MNVIDTISLSIIAFFVLIFAIKGLKKVIFSIISIILAVCIARFAGNSVGEILISDVFKTGFAGLSDDAIARLNGILPNLLGTLIVFLLCFIVIRLLLKIVEMRMGVGLHSIIINRLLGAIAGLIIGISFLFILSYVIEVINAGFEVAGVSNSFTDALDKSKIWNIMKNLN